MDRLQTIYGTEINKRRGLINGLGSIAKTLFGTMDADDEQLINEQLMLLHNTNEATQHALKNQIKVINSTIAHVGNLEDTIEQNEKTLMELIKQIQSTIVIHNRRNDLDEHFTIIDAMISDLTRDAAETLEYLMYIKQGSLHPKLTPIENIISNLKEAAAGLPEGLYFPFTCQKQEWLSIEKVTTITAYCDKENIYSILKFPLATLPTYEILHAIPLPVYDHEDVFTAIEIRNHWIAVDSDRHTYITLSDEDFQNCIKIHSEYLCAQNFITHRINNNAICELKMYLHSENHPQCNSIHTTATGVIWVKAKNSWLYSAPTEESIIIQCKNYPEEKRVIKHTGKITLEGDCKIITNNAIIKSATDFQTKLIEAYLPKINITLLRDMTPIENNTEEIKLKRISQNPNELKYLSMKLNKINKDLSENQVTFFKQKQFIYPMTTSCIATLAVVVLITYIIIVKIKRKNRIAKLPTIKSRSDLDKISKNCTTTIE